jgi:dTDP-4-amino-4,6-dideoxygalactose transaminase
MGLVELQRYDADMLIRRRAIFDRYNDAFGRYEWAQLPDFQTKDRQSSFHVYLLRLKNINEQTRDLIMEEIFAQDVAVNVHFVPLPMMSYYKSCGFDIADFPVAYDNFSREISLPVYYDLNDEMAGQVVSAVLHAVKKHC